MGRDQRLGLTIGSTFGLVFVLVNAGPLPALWPLLLRIAGVLAFVGVQLSLRAAARRPAADRVDGGGAGFTRGYWIVVAVEVVALFGGLHVLSRFLDAPEAGVAWVSVVVGLHFNALAVVWQQRSLHVAGAALTVCGAIGLALAAAGAGEAPIAVVGGVVPGFVLLYGAAWAARQTGRLSQPA